MNYELDKATKVEFVETIGNTSKFNVYISSNWTIGAAPHGGYLLALLISATEGWFSRLGQGHSRPLGMSAVFLTTALTEKPAWVEVTPIRVKGRWGHVQAILKQNQNQEDTAVVTSFITYGKPGQDSMSQISFKAVDAPPLPKGWNDGQPLGPWYSGFAAPPMFKSETTGKNMNDMVFKWVHESEFHAVGKEPNEQIMPDGWSRLDSLGGDTIQSIKPGINVKPIRVTICGFKDGRPCNDAKALAFFSDLVTPPMLNHPGYDWMNLRPWFPTMHMLVDFRSVGQDGEPWVVIRADTEFMTNGQGEVESQVWNSNGDCVALSQQNTLVVGFDKNLRKSKL